MSPSYATVPTTAATGADVGGWLVAGGGLLAGGVLLVVAARRRST